MKEKTDENEVFLKRVHMEKGLLGRRSFGKEAFEKEPFEKGSFEKNPFEKRFFCSAKERRRGGILINISITKAEGCR